MRRFLQGRRIGAEACGLVVLLGALAVGALAASVPPPLLGRLIDVTPLNGKVYITVPGQAKSLLTAERQVPVGSVLDASAGAARATAADMGGAAPYSGDFSQGEFNVLQNPSGGGVTQIVVLGACTKATATGVDRGATVARPPHHGVRRFLSITANGKFVIVGANATAYETGAASWIVNDNCDGSTSIADRAGRVREVNRAGAAGQLAPGQRFVGYCHPRTGPLDYCQGALSEPDGNSGSFDVILEHRHEKGFNLCLLRGGHALKCEFAPFKPHGSGTQDTLLSCLFDTLPRGTYQARYLVRGVQLGILLPFTTNHAHDPFGPMDSCTAFFTFVTPIP